MADPVTRRYSGGTAKAAKVKKPGENFPGFILCPYGPAHATGIPAGGLYAGLIKNAIQARQRRQG